MIATDTSVSHITMVGINNDDELAGEFSLEDKFNYFKCISPFSNPAGKGLGKWNMFVGQIYDSKGYSFCSVLSPGNSLSPICIQCHDECLVGLERIREMKGIDSAYFKM